MMNVYVLCLYDAMWGLSTREVMITMQVIMLMKQIIL